MKLLNIINLHVSVEKKNILHDVDLVVEPGSVHVLMGPNGSGKSTFAYALAGHPKYSITKGKLYLEGEDITTISANERARKGLFVAFQQVPTIPGLTVFSFLKEACRALLGEKVDGSTFYRLLQKKCELLAIDGSFLDRSLYDGFSGGEKKRLEILQLLLFKPKVAILDEIDSGVDVDSLSFIARGIRELRNEKPHGALVVITHYQHILKHIQPDYVHILLQGTIVQSGTIALADHIVQHGYQL